MQDHLRELEALEVIHEHVATWGGHTVGALRGAVTTSL